MPEVKKSASAAPRTGRPQTSIFGRAAPSPCLLLPKNRIITFGEMGAYFPNACRNYDILLRFVQAGLSQQTIANVVNLHRNWEKWPARDNSICKEVKKEFVNEGYGDWSITNHNEGLYEYDRQWLGGELTLYGTLLNCEKYPKYNGAGKVKNLPIPEIVFADLADLAKNVRTHPSHLRGDGFMLTRCVQYAAAHPEKGYVFPRDYAHLPEELDDGRIVTAAHYDEASIARFESKRLWAANEPMHVEILDEVEDSDNEETEDNLVSTPTLVTT